MRRHRRVLSAPVLAFVLAAGAVACEDTTTETEDAEFEEFDDPGDDPTLDAEDPEGTEDAEG